ncbi:glycosyl transferase [Tenacibaculum aestuariivivum]|uniref:glycosyl transferase n=1 Tax=Tenacibaculum aestuariivivum TaxID=2006131 RepID=UPI003AB6F667
MKVFKELPKSIYYSLYLRLQTVTSLTKNKTALPVIVSLTSIPERLNNLDLVIKSILNQDKIVPSKIILWLHNDLKDKIPNKLSKLESVYFEIKYSDLKCSHRKLIHSLNEYPNMPIITCDDDLIYREDFIVKLYEEHLKYPNDIIGNGVKQIKINNNGSYEPYVNWGFKKQNSNYNCLLPIGAWGIFYPVNSMPKKIHDIDLFMQLAPKADDLWFKAMSLTNNVISRESLNKPKSPIPIIGSQKVSLQQENVKKKKNEVQWLALSNFFNLDKILLTKETKN